MCVLWGTTYLGIRIALETIPPGLVGGLRYTAAGTLLLAILASRGEGVVPRSQWLGLAFIGFRSRNQSIHAHTRPPDRLGSYKSRHRCSLPTQRNSTLQMAETARALVENASPQ